jgi:endoglycosylceramidase
MATRPVALLRLFVLVLCIAGFGCTEPIAIGATGGSGGQGGVGGSGGAEEPSPRFIRDGQGRAIILHGLNIANGAKSDPFRVGATTREFVLHMKRAWGFNASRHLIFWDAIEPEPGAYDDAYLDRLGERLDWYADAGVLAVLDMHQDVYSTVFCCDGAPAWAVRTDGIPFEPRDVWWANYLEPAVERAFDNFWDYEGAHADVQEAYISAWLHVIERFRDHPAVLGYDLMNEPDSGSKGASEFERTMLPEFYDRFIARIRDVDPDAWIFYEPTAFIVNPGGPSDLASVHDTRAGDPRLVYAPHLYEPTIFLGGGYDGSDAIERWEANRLAEIEERHPGPLVIGELGGGPPDYHRDVFAMADRLGSGWMRWSSDPFFEAFVDGREPDDILGTVRVYPQRIAGDPLDFAYNSALRVFSLRFAQRDAVQGPTEIYIPEARIYPDGWTLSVSDPAGSWSSDWDPEHGLLSITTDPTQAEHLIRIEPGMR